MILMLRGMILAAALNNLNKYIFDLRVFTCFLFNDLRVHLRLRVFLRPVLM